jgi:hypothetical protein
LSPDTFTFTAPPAEPEHVTWNAPLDTPLPKLSADTNAQLPPDDDSTKPREKPDDTFDTPSVNDDADATPSTSAPPTGPPLSVGWPPSTANHCALVTDADALPSTTPTAPSATADDDTLHDTVNDTDVPPDATDTGDAGLKLHVLPDALKPKPNAIDGAGDTDSDTDDDAVLASTIPPSTPPDSDGCTDSTAKLPDVTNTLPSLSPDTFTFTAPPADPEHVTLNAPLVTPLPKLSADTNAQLLPDDESTKPREKPDDAGDTPNVNDDADATPSTSAPPTAPPVSDG